MALRDSSEAKATRRSARRIPGAFPVEYWTLALCCPVCRTELIAEVPAVGQSEARETDLRPLFGPIDPIPWSIHACPSCSYTAYRSGFESSHRDELAETAEPLRPGDRLPARLLVPEDQALEELRRWIRRGELARGVAEGREPYGAERYILGARCHEFLREEDGLAIADYYLRASWSARSTGDRAQERACQREAAQRLLGLLEGGQVPELERARSLYLAGELSRRSGAFAQAVDAFSQIEPMVDRDEAEGALFAHLAQRQLALAVVKSEVNAVIAEADIGLERE